jgi:hypothetical protein
MTNAGDLLFPGDHYDLDRGQEPKYQDFFKAGLLSGGRIGAWRPNPRDRLS